MTDALQLVHEWSPLHRMYKCTINSLLELQLYNWEYNRPPDITRAQEISIQLIQSKCPVDWVFYCFQNTTTNTIKIVDGMHRYTALKIIEKETNKPVDYLTSSLREQSSPGLVYMPVTRSIGCSADWTLTPSVYATSGDTKWLYDSYVFVVMRINPSFGVVADWYQTINKSHPVPELYMQSPDYCKKNMIEKVVKEWMKKYKTNFSTALRPNMGNTNRELFIELLDWIYETNNTKNENDLYARLDDYNQYARTHHPKGCTSKVLEKCEKSGCYLFLYKPDYWKQN